MSSNYGSLAATNGGAKTTLDANETVPLLANTFRHQDSSSGSSNASIWSKMVFGWFSPVLEIGNEKKKLDPEDLNTILLPKDCSTNDIMDKFNMYWELEKEKAKDPKTSKSSFLATPSIPRALFNAYGTDFIRAGFLKLIHDCSLFVGPQVLNGLIYYLRNANAPISEGLSLTLTVTISQLLMSFCLRHYFFNCYLTGLRIRSAVVVAVYQKALVLNAAERQTRTVGEITNLMSIDAQRMQDLTTCKLMVVILS